MTPGITTYEALSYGYKTMVYLLFVYVIGVVISILGIFMIIEEMVTFGGLVFLFGLSIIFAGLHGLVYKSAGDAMARIISESELSTNQTAKKIKKDQSGINERDESG